MLETNPEKLAKLPKWAKEHIAHLERELEKERDKSTYLDFPAVDYKDRKRGKIYAQFGNYDYYTELPDRTQVIFPTGAGTIEVRSRHTEYLELMGDTRLTIVPQVTNVIRVTSER